MLRMEMKYDSLYSGLVSINKSLGGTQSMPDSEYGAMIDLMETISNKPVGESGDVFDAVSTVATMAENGELPIQGGGDTPSLKLDSVSVDITANGSYEYLPSEFELDGFAGFVANVNVPTTGGGTKIDVGGLGLKFSYSIFSSVPDSLDFTNVTDMNHMFYSCVKLITIPQLDTSNVTTMVSMFDHCGNLPTIPQLDTSNVTNMQEMFRYCYELTTISQLDTSNVTSMYGMFQSCSNLTTIPQLDTSNVTSMSNMFNGCSNLESIPLLDCGKVDSINSMFNPSYYGDHIYLTDMGGFKNLKVNLDIQKAPNLTVDSLMNVINNVYDFVGNGETTTRTLTIGTTNLNKLTDEQKVVATNKGWNLT